MPVIIACEVENARTFHVECHVPVLCELIEEMRGVRTLIAAFPIVRASHVGSDPDALNRPALLLSICVESDWNNRHFRRQRLQHANRCTGGRQTYRREPHHVCTLVSAFSKHDPQTTQAHESRFALRAPILMRAPYPPSPIHACG